MNLLSSSHFDLLKIEVLETAGLKSIVPSDCKTLSLNIEYATRQIISETTLKRTFGFAISKFNQSKFTIDALCKYCGYDSWDEFCKQKDSLMQTVRNEDIDWFKLKNQAKKITMNTLRALKNSSGIPFNLTIRRNFLESHMQRFEESGAMGTVIASPAGQGKTIAMCHWVEEKINIDNARNNDNVTLFFSSHALIAATHSAKDLMAWTLGLLGYDTDQGFNFLFKSIQQKRTFYLIIDGFDSFLLKKELFNRLISQLGDIFSLYSERSNLKIILTMRSSTWVNHMEDWETEKFKWFTLPGNIAQHSNFPLFSENEILLLRRNVTVDDNSPITESIANTLRHPLYFQYYFKHFRKDFSFLNFNSLSRFDLLLTFAINKIHIGPQASEKLVFIMDAIGLMNLSEDRPQLGKLTMLEQSRQYPVIYADLLGMGIFNEIRGVYDLLPVTNFVFADDNVFAYFIAKTLFHSNKDTFDAVLIDQLNYRLQSSIQKAGVLKWCILFDIKSGQHKNLALIPKALLNPKEKAGLVVFIVDLLKKESFVTTNNEAALHYFQQDFGAILFNYLFGIELISPEYRTALATLTKFNLSLQQVLLVHTALGCIAAMQLDLNELAFRLEQLRKSDFESSLFLVINPVDCLEVIYDFLKYGIINKKTLAKFTKASFEMAALPDGSVDNCGSNDMLLLLGIYTARLFGNAKKTLRFINLVSRVYRPDAGSSFSGFSFMINSLTADTYFSLGNNNNYSNFLSSIIANYTNNLGHLTPLMHCMYAILTIETGLQSGDYNMLKGELKKIDEVLARIDNNVCKLYTLMLILTNQGFSDYDLVYKKQLLSQYKEIVNTRGLSGEQFNIVLV
jgi:hypothetical protein